MKISFIIPAYNEESCIGACLASIQEEVQRAHMDAEIIVVNNASCDRTREIALGFPGVRVIDEPRKGTNYARQAGLAAAHGEFVANIDADVTVPPGWLARGIEYFSKNPALVAVGGPYRYRDLSARMNFFVRVYYRLVFAGYLFNRFILRGGSVIQGGNVIIKRRALESIGGYDTRFRFHGDDADLAFRLRKAGPVKFTLAFPVYSSGRRLAAIGAATMAVRYVLNYLWPMFFKKPFTKNSPDIRFASQRILPYTPENRLLEWAMAAGLAVFFLAAAGGVGYGAYRLIRPEITNTAGFVRVKAATREETRKLRDNFAELSSAGRTLLNARREAAER